MSISSNNTVKSSSNLIGSNNRTSSSSSNAILQFSTPQVLQYDSLVPPYRRTVIVDDDIDTVETQVSAQGKSRLLRFLGANCGNAESDIPVENLPQTVTPAENGSKVAENAHLTKEDDLLPPGKQNVRLNGAKYFLTYSRCPIPKDVAIKLLLDKKYKHYARMFICQEHHKQGVKGADMGLHLHVYIEFKPRIDVKNATAMRYFDLIHEGITYHPNVQTARSCIGCYIYMTKEDVDLQFDGCTQEDFEKDKKVKVFDMIARSILKGETFSDVVRVHPGQAMQNKRKFEEFIAYAEDEKVKQSKIPWRELPVDSNDMWSNNDQVIGWLNQNIKKPRVLRQVHLFIHGPTQTGKSTLLAELYKRLNVYLFPREELFHHMGIKDADLVVFDEFRSKPWTLAALNDFLGGAPCGLKMKGIPQYQYTKNLPCIFLSNNSIEELFKNAADPFSASHQRFLAFKSRFLVIDTSDGKIDPYGVYKQFVSPIISSDKFLENGKSVGSPDLAEESNHANVVDIIEIPDFIDEDDYQNMSKYP